ncbi:hypothetical protein X975_08704, partial [Stegodyphus mimosarum]
MLEETAPGVKGSSVFGSDLLDSVPIFTGGENSISLTDVLDRLDLIASHVGWTESDKVTVIRVKLGGEACKDMLAILEAIFGITLIMVS